MTKECNGACGVKILFLRNNQCTWLISCLKVKIKCFIWVTHALTTYIHTIYGGAIHFGLALWVTHARAQALPFCHDGVDEKTFWVFDVTAFFLRMAFWLLTEENGSCAAQLPHAPFKIKKATLEVPQLEYAIFSLVVQESDTWPQPDPINIYAAAYI